MPIAYNVNYFKDPDTGTITPINLRYLLQGPEDGPVVVLIMGLGSQMTCPYNTIVAPLIQNGFRVVRIENRDSGHSTCLTQYEPQGIATNIVTSMFNPGTDKNSPLLYDFNTNEQKLPLLWTTPEDLNITINNNNGNNNGQILADDYDVYPGFQPREIIIDAIIQNRTKMLHELNAKQGNKNNDKITTTTTTTTTTTETPKVEGTETTNEDGSKSQDQGDTTPSTPSTPSTEQQSSQQEQQEQQQPPHQLITDLNPTTTRPYHRSPIAHLLQEYFFCKEKSKIANTQKSIYDISDLAVDVICLINQLQIQRFSIVGFSMGGMIALYVANLVPNRIISYSGVMTTTGHPLYNPSLFFLFRNLALRIRPQHPPFPRIIQKDNENDDNNNEQVMNNNTNPNDKNGNLTLMLTTDGEPLPISNEEGGNITIFQNDKDNSNTVKSPSDVSSSTSPTSPQPNQQQPTTKQLQKEKEQQLKAYKLKLKDFNKNLELWHNYINFLVETNGSVGTPNVDPITNRIKTYNNGKSVIEHISRWVQRCPMALGVKRQSVCISTSPPRDSLLYFMTQYIPCLFVAGCDDELVPKENTTHQLSIAKAALYNVGLEENKKIEKIVQNGDQIVTTDENQLDSTPTPTPQQQSIQNNDEESRIRSESSKDWIAIDQRDISYQNQSNQSSTTSTPVQTPTPNNNEQGSTKINTITTNVNMNSIVKECTEESSTSIVSTIYGKNQYTNKYLQHQAVYVKRGKHELADMYCEVFMPHLIQHLITCRDQLNNTTNEINIKESHILPIMEFTSNEDLLYGFDDNDLEYYDPNALPPTPPDGYTLVKKGIQWTLQSSSQTQQSSTQTQSPTPTPNEQSNNNDDESDNNTQTTTNSNNNEQNGTNNTNNSNNNNNNSSSGFFSKLKRIVFKPKPSSNDDNTTQSTSNDPTNNDGNQQQQQQQQYNEDDNNQQYQPRLQQQQSLSLSRHSESIEAVPQPQYDESEAM